MRVKFFCVLGAVVMCAFFSCATTPPIPGEPRAVIRFLDAAELVRKYGRDYKVNPYLAPSGMLRGKPYEFVVAEVSISSPTRALVAIQGVLRDEAGELIAPLATFDGMERLWSDWSGSEVYDPRRQDTLERYYPRTLAFTVHRTRKVLVVFVAKNPIPRPAEAELSVEVAGFLFQQQLAL